MDSYKTSGSSPSKNGRIEYPDKDHVLLSVDTIRLYATQGKSPYVGIPIVTDKSRSPAVFPRQILRAAVESPGHIKAYYDNETKTLTLNGRRNRYRLVDQTSRLELWQIIEPIRKWAHGQQRSKAARERNKLYGPLAPLAKRTREQIRKLERQREKLYVHRPANPLLKPSEEYTDRWREHTFENWKRFIDEKPIRKALSRLAAGGRGKDGKTWAQFHQAIAAVIGRAELSRDQQYPVLRNRKDSPHWENYWKRLPKFLYLASKPWNANAWEFDPQRVQRSRHEYCHALRNKREIDDQIEQLKDLLKQYEQGLKAVYGVVEVPR
jgi:hypothetical protein